MVSLAPKPTVAEINSADTLSFRRRGPSKMQSELSPRPSSTRLKSALSVLLSLDSADKTDSRDHDSNNWDGFLPSSMKNPAPEVFYVENAYTGANTSSSFYASYK
ncbi:hypothetical protein EON64_20020, partial [archaeon]